MAGNSHVNPDNRVFRSIDSTQRFRKNSVNSYDFSCTLTLCSLYWKTTKILGNGKPMIYLKKITFLEFHKVVRWHISGEVDTFIQPSGVTFPQDTVYQKLLKSVHVWQSYSKKQKGGSFFGTQFSIGVTMDMWLAVTEMSANWRNHDVARRRRAAPQVGCISHLFVHVTWFYAVTWLAGKPEIRQWRHRATAT